MFEPERVARVFEAATSVRIELRVDESFDRFRVSHPVARQLPRVAMYDSTKSGEDRFGGRFSVRVFEQDDPDEGVRDDGLDCALPERGPQVRRVSGWTIRANVDVLYRVDADAITPAMEAAWSVLTSFL